MSNEVIPVDSEVNLDQRFDVTDQEIDDINKEFGLVPVSQGFNSKLGRMGIQLEQIGVVKFANGASSIGINGLILCIQQLTNRLHNPDLANAEAIDLSKAVGYIVEKLAKINKTAVESDVATRAVNEESFKRKRRSYIPSAVVQINVQNQKT